MNLRYKTWQKEININFCPMCGRVLRKEAEAINNIETVHPSREEK